MRHHLSVLALCIRLKLRALLLILLAAAALPAAVFSLLGFGQAWGSGYGPGISVLWVVWAAAYLALMAVCIGPGEKRAKTGCLLQRLQISERAILIWDALAAALCFLLLYCAMILTVFGLAWLCRRSPGYASGPQGVFLMLARSSLLHGLLPFGESAVWTRNLLYALCAGLCCAAAGSSRRNRNRPGAAVFSLIFLAARAPVALGEGDMSIVWLLFVLVGTAIAFGPAMLAAHNGTRRSEEDEPQTDTP